MSDMLAEDHASKRPRPEYVLLHLFSVLCSNFVLSGDVSTQEQQTIQAMVVVAEHVLDQHLKGIAAQFRFTEEEVREYYDKCGDMDRTGRRFQKMRETLALLPDDDF